ncbi:MAG: SIS domain-containing protein [Bacteroidota bacterium]
MDTKSILKNFFDRYPLLHSCENDIQDAISLLIDCFEKKGQLLICGNGGSSSDAEHIVGELMKSFSQKRPVDKDLVEELEKIERERGGYLADKLDRALPAISLSAHSGLNTAVSNDIGGDLIFAQQVMGYGRKNDVLLAISTSGNSQNIIDAAIVAKAKGLKVIGLTGQTGGRLKQFCDEIICVPATKTPIVQEYHLPVYHTICQILEHHFFL